MLHLPLRVCLLVYTGTGIRQLRSNVDVSSYGPICPHPGTPIQVHSKSIVSAVQDRHPVRNYFARPHAMFTSIWFEHLICLRS